MNSFPVGGNCLYLYQMSHEKIVGVSHFNISQNHIANVPHGFLSVGNANVGKFEVLHFAEHLGGVDPCVRHFKVRTVPQGCACTLGEKAILNYKTVNMPERVFTFESAIDGVDIAAFFQRRFTGMNCYIF